MLFYSLLTNLYVKYSGTTMLKKASWYVSHTCYVKAVLCRRSILSSETGGKDMPQSITTPQKRVKEE